ncbi:hypothetical protein ACWKWC_12075 [Geodermatophilus nigrescens]
MTVSAMRAAVVAIHAGVFDCHDGADDVFPRTAPGAALGEGAPPLGAARVSWADVEAEARVTVLPGHAGAGASTVALVVAEGLAASRRVQLVEYTDPARSGLTAASTIELGTDGAWRRGRRGRLDVLRLAQPLGTELPTPLARDDRDAVLVVDAGWATTTALLEGRSSLRSGDLVVVTTRVTVPAMRQTEQVLAAVGGDAWVAAVGPSRWPRAVEATVGSNLGRLRARGRVVRVPWDARLAVAGLTGDRLPRHVAGAGRSLAERLVPAGPPRHRRRAEP